MKEKLEESLTWEQVVAASAKETTPAETPEVQIQAGDLVDHPTLGCGTVYQAKGTCLNIVTDNGREFRLSTEFISLTPRGIQNGRRLFQATI